MLLSTYLWQYFMEMNILNDYKYEWNTPLLHFEQNTCLIQPVNISL